MNTLIVIGIIAVAVIVVVLLLVRYGMKYMASDEVKEMPLPGDNLINKTDQVLLFTKEIEINAPADIIWQHMAQQGQDKAGFYSFDRLERLCTFKIKNTYKIVPEWSKIKPGDWMPYHQSGLGSEIIDVEEGKYFTMLSDTRKPPVNKDKKAFAIRAVPGGEFAWTWNFVIQPIAENNCRLAVRCHNHFSPNNLITKPLVRLFIGIPSIVMTTRQMELLKDCAEGKMPKGTLLRSGHKN